MAAALIPVAERFAAKLPQRLSRLEADSAELTAETLATALLALERDLHDIAGTAQLLGYPALGAAARYAERDAGRLRSQQATAGHERIAALQSAIRKLRASAALDDI